MTSTDYTDFNNPPACDICGQPLTINEWDDEPGGRPSFYSRHSACSHASRDGRFVIVTLFDGQQTRSIAEAPGYAYEKRATEQAEYLARNNRCRYVFAVWDRESRLWTGSRVRGSLREVSPSGQPFYGEVWTVRDTVGA